MCYGQTDRNNQGAEGSEELKAGRKIRISQCMIVKNEEENIRQALSWGKDMMWEQIVVDTGSTDRTVEIAREMGAKIFFFPWIDDFAAAKNYAIDQAKGDWIAFLDADEYMVPDGIQKMWIAFEQIAGKNLDGIFTGWQHLDDNGNIFSSGSQVRFFRNDPDIRYRRRIHEQLSSISGRKLRYGDVVQDISIFHTGYQSAFLFGRNKSKRNRKLILEEINEHPEDHEMLGYMGDDCFSVKEKEDAREWYLKAIQAMPASLDSSDQRSALTFSNLLSIMTEELRVGREGLSDQECQTLLDKIYEIYQKAVTLLPEEADFDYIMGVFYGAVGQIQGGARHLELAIQKLERHGCYNKALLTAANLLTAYDILVSCCYELGERDKCAAYAVTYLKYNPYEMGVLARLIKLLIPEAESGGVASKMYQEVLGVLSKLYDFSVLKDRIFLIKTAEGAGRKDFAVFLLNNLFSEEEQEQLQLTTRLNP